MLFVHVQPLYGNENSDDGNSEDERRDDAHNNILHGRHRRDHSVSGRPPRSPSGRRGFVV